MKIYMKSINRAYKQVWMIEMLPRNTKRPCNEKQGKNLTGIDTCENIRLIQACIYHDYYQCFPKGKG